MRAQHGFENSKTSDGGDRVVLDDNYNRLRIRLSLCPPSSLHPSFIRPSFPTTPFPPSSSSSLLLSFPSTIHQSINSTLAMSTEKERETLVYHAKLSEQAERYEEMVESMKKLAKLDLELTLEERNLLSVGYKNVIGARRASWRIISSIEQKEETKGNENNVKWIKEYRRKVEEELSNICNDILSIIDQHLIPCSKNGEATVFYYKM